MNIRRSATNRYNKSFTLIELLVVLALVAILSVVVVMTLNPAELIKQARDSNRLSDLSTINTALNLFSADVTSGFMGTSTVVYVSIPDNASSTCGSLGLPALPTGYTYNCVTTASLRNTNGTGWIPVNFQRISSNSPISQLPIDPQNTTSTKYYTYVTGGSWQLSTRMESSKYQATTYTSGGADPSIYTIGNNLSLAPFVGGLVGWWRFEEGAGATSTDYSGFGNNGTWNGVSTHYAAGKFGRYSGNFDGSTDYINIATQPYFSATTPISISAWAKVSMNLHTSGVFGHGAWDYTLAISADLLPRTYLWNNGGSEIGSAVSPTMGALNTWTHLTAVIDYPNKTNSLFVNGVLAKTTSITGVISDYSSSLLIGTDPHGASWRMTGLIDDARFYKRALSPAEILSIYNATK